MLLGLENEHLVDNREKTMEMQYFNWEYEAKKIDITYNIKKMIVPGNADLGETLSEELCL
jgi:hypothetical protein